MTTTDHPAQRINGPTELLRAVPYLLGFHPHQSLVLIGLADGVLVVTARLDLNDVAYGQPCLGDTVDAIVRAGATTFVGAVYTDTPPGDRPGEDARLPHHRVASALASAVEQARARLIDCLLVTGDRWRSSTCEDADCCPPAGRVLPIAPSAFEAAATYAGIAVAPSRVALAERLAPLPDRDSLTGLIHRAESDGTTALGNGCLTSHQRGVKRAIFAAARAAAGAPDAVFPNDSEAASYGAALSSIAIRDAIWMAVDDGRLTGGELWLNLGRRLPSPYDAPALFLYGWHAWRAGNGALASIAAERTIASDPGYSAADLLLAALARGIDPRTLPKLRAPSPTKGGAQRPDGA